MHIRTILPVLLVASLPLSASAAVLSVDPAAASYGPGDTFIASVRIDPKGECINTAQIELSFPSDELRAVDVARGNSIFSLWIGEPQIDNTTGRVTFSGGVPAGYCGQIPGDPSVSNVLGQVVFTVLKTAATRAVVHLLPTSLVYRNDGLGTKAELAFEDAVYSLQAAATQAVNPWVQAISADSIPPEPFTVHVESTVGVFGGAYYAVFSTVDKQSGIDHYEIYEHGVWQHVTTPHVLADQLLSTPVQVKAIDKAGNERLGTYDASTTPARVSGEGNLVSVFVLILGLIVLIVAHRLWERRVALGSQQSPSV
jgi:hypothetical protein